jgi:8-oxo-dGTP pyrophosphatase MutT (NUDIX family)
MMEPTSPRWLDWAREIQALAQTGLTFCQNDYDKERLQRLLEIAADIVASHTDLPQESLRQNFLRQPGYATPKVDVRGAVIRDGKILLVQERTDERWCMPGGWADVGESLPRWSCVKCGGKRLPCRAAQSHRRLRCQPHRSTDGILSRLQNCLPLRDHWRKARPSNETSPLNFQLRQSAAALVEPHQRASLGRNPGARGTTIDRRHLIENGLLIRYYSLTQKCHSARILFQPSTVLDWNKMLRSVTKEKQADY